MNRWTGTGHLTKDPKFLETENGTSICTLRIAVKRAGKQGQAKNKILPHVASLCKRTRREPPEEVTAGRSTGERPA